MGGYSDYPLLLAIAAMGTTAHSDAQDGPPRVGSAELAPRQLGLLAERIQGIPVLILALFPTSSAAAYDLGFCSGLKGCICLMGRDLPGEDQSS